MIEFDGVKLFNGDCLDVLATLPENSIDSIVTDPPYGLGFMGKAWDALPPGVDVMRECLRVLKPGGHLLAFGGSRTYHRLAVSVEDAGFEIRDQIMWVYGSGFPKSLDVSKALDKQRTEDLEPIRAICRVIRAAMDAQGIKSRDLTQYFGGCHPRLIDHWAARDTDSQPAIPTWDQWQTLRAVLGIDDRQDAEVRRLNSRKGQPGDAWQTAEVIGKHEGATPGFGELRFSVRDTKIRAASDQASKWQGWGTALKPAHEPIVVARKPLIGTVAQNVLTHGTGALNIDACRVTDGTETGKEKPDYRNAVFGEGLGGGAWENTKGRFPANFIHDGLPQDWARFFYCAKASKADRTERGRVDNRHPTVKPVDLMRYLCRLVTPPGGAVLDPFMGSGSTGKAAILEGFDFVGVERELESFDTALNRIALTLAEAEAS